MTVYGAWRGKELTAPMRAGFEKQALTDEQACAVLAGVFERAVMLLAELGEPNCTVHVCNPSEEP